MAASGFGLDLGPPTCTAAIVTVVLATKCRAKATREIATSVAWMVLPLVAGLFVIVEGLDRAGALLAVSHPFGGFAAMPRLVGELAASFGVAGLCNVMNNLPAGLLAGSPLQTAHAVPGIRDAVLIGVDLGPNLSVTGSLATVLWLIALRREGIEIGGRRFLKAGALVMPPAFFLSSLVLSLLSPARVNRFETLPDGIY
jgi:arsenical pump membrane protein